MKNCNVHEATHVKINGKYERIIEKSGVFENGRLAKTSEGGFSVKTEAGRSISMYQAEAYAKEEK